MHIDDVQSSYARWAPFYDNTFGAVTDIGRRRVVDLINGQAQQVLEVGVGTGLSLRHYHANVAVTGIDFSEDMLARAAQRVEEMNLDQIKELRRMDARQLDFPDNSFDTVAAMHVMSVVPEPEKVMSEIARVCKPGGRVIISNHFRRTRGALAWLARAVRPVAYELGWHSDFAMETVLQDHRLTLEQVRPLPPMGMMTMLIFRKPAAA